MGAASACPSPPGGADPCATLFDSVTADNTIHLEEIFEPVLAVLRVSDHDATPALVNGRGGR